MLCCSGDTKCSLPKYDSTFLSNHRIVIMVLTAITAGLSGMFLATSASNSDADDKTLSWYEMENDDIGKLWISPYGLRIDHVSGATMSCKFSDTDCCESAAGVLDYEDNKGDICNMCHKLGNYSITAASVACVSTAIFGGLCTLRFAFATDTALFKTLQTLGGFFTFILIATNVALFQEQCAEKLGGVYDDEEITDLWPYMGQVVVCGFVFIFTCMVAGISTSTEAAGGTAGVEKAVPKSRMAEVLAKDPHRQQLQMTKA